MEYFNYRNNELYCEEIPLREISQTYGTPTYVYSYSQIKKNCDQFIKAFSKYPTLICFATKANSNLTILSSIFKRGLGADLVSVGELERSLAAGIDPQKIVFSGVGKQRHEVERAVKVGILLFNVESNFEIDLIGDVASSLGKQVGIALRVNPNIDAQTHAKISTGLHSTKFGLLEEDAIKLASTLKSHPNLKLLGLSCHIGSQIASLSPLKEAAERLVNLANSLKSEGHALRYLDMGGGLGIRYEDEVIPDVADYAKTLISAVAPTKLNLILEPGRAIIGNASVLLTQVIGVKSTTHKHFVVLDTAMNDLMRPALYDSFHGISPVSKQNITTNDRATDPRSLDFVGPICETTDILGVNRLQSIPNPRDLMVIENVGAYGSTMSSTYNSRPKLAEVLVIGDKMIEIRQREQLEAIWADEKLGLKASQNFIFPAP